MASVPHLLSTNADARLAGNHVRRVLLISPDAVGERMAGLGIRVTELARVLAADPATEVVVATGALSETDAYVAPTVRVVGYEPHAPAALRPWVAWAQCIVAPPQWPIVTVWLRRSGKRIVFDLYDPETLETLELFDGRRRALRHLMVALTLDRLEDALRTGHHFMCASTAQRDLWTGALLSTRRLTSDVYDADRALRETIDIVPFGLSAAPPPNVAGPGPREAFPDVIAPDDEIVLWNGGIWPWLDAPTAIRAVARLAASRPGLRLVFMGRGEHFAARAAREEALEVARGLGVLGSAVLFSDAWVPYEKRSGWLAQASCALATAGDHLETRYAFRTRLLDCLWAGLPIVCTSGDDLAARVVRDDLGSVVAPGDVEGLAQALAGVLDRGRNSYAGALAGVARDYEWSAVAEPLRRWVALDGEPQRSSGRASRRPAHLVRSAGYRASRGALAAVGLGWPSQ